MNKVESLGWEVGEHLFDSAMLMAHDELLIQNASNCAGAYATTMLSYPLNKQNGIELYRLVYAAMDFADIGDHDPAQLFYRSETLDANNAYNLNKSARQERNGNESVLKLALAGLGLRDPAEIIPHMLTLLDAGRCQEEALRFAYVATDDLKENMMPPGLPKVHLTAQEVKVATGGLSRTVGWRQSGRSFSMSLSAEGTPPELRRVAKTLGPGTYGGDNAPKKLDEHYTEEDLIGVYVTSQESLDAMYSTIVGIAKEKQKNLAT